MRIDTNQTIYILHFKRTTKLKGNKICLAELTLFCEATGKKACAIFNIDVKQIVSVAKLHTVGVE